MVRINRISVQTVDISIRNQAWLKRAGNKHFLAAWVPTSPGSQNAGDPTPPPLPALGPGHSAPAARKCYYQLFSATKYLSSSFAFY